MAEVIRMPLLSDTMTEGVIAEWLKKVGDTVKSGDILAEVETDKATMELENYADGTLLYVAADKGQAIEVNGVLAVVGKPGEDYQSLLDGEGGSSNGAAAETKAEPAPAEQPKTTEEPKKAEAPKAAVDLSSIKATAVRMPLLSDTMTEGVIANWVVNVGDKVKSGDILAEVETDKATMELENYDDGVLLYIGVEAGKAAQVNQIIAIVGEEGANFQAILDAENGTSSAPAEAKEEAPAASVNGSSAEASQSSDAEGRIKASPLAKSIAKDKGINLSDVTGSGENGRIVKKDLDTFTPAAKEAPAAAATPAAQPAAAAPAPKPAAVPEPAGEYEDLPVTSMRKTIARRLSESLYTAPHFYLTMEITMDNAMKFRGQVNEVSPAKISFNDFAIKAAALALKQHPAVNASWLGDKIRRYKYINIGVAVAVEDGLVVPVVRNADQKTLSTISTEVKDYAGKAKSKKLQPKEMEGSTFSISNLGMFGVEEFNPIINSPDSCILAVGGIKKTVGVNDAGEFFVTNIMKVTLACDHRAVDGATGAAFLQTFKQLIEDPMRMLV